MAEIQGGGDSQGKGGKKRAKKQSTRVDMTPLVDLAFLLLTFFVLTSTFSKPKVLRMIFPEKIEDNTNIKKPEVRDAVTILVSGDDRIFYYTGQISNATAITEIDYTKDGLRKLLKEKNFQLLSELQKLQVKLNETDEKDTAAVNKIDRDVKKLQKESKLVVLVKNDDKATYKNIIDVMDEFMITQVAKYFVTDDGFNAIEKKLVAQIPPKK
jgi:biopolymer transport protein ExbD